MQRTTGETETGTRLHSPPRVFSATANEGAEPLEQAAPATIDFALELIAADRPVEADQLLTAALLRSPGRGDLWLAAGIARLRRGAVRSAAAALRMAAWIGDDALARALLVELGR